MITESTFRILENTLPLTVELILGSSRDFCITVSGALNYEQISEIETENSNGAFIGDPGLIWRIRDTALTLKQHEITELVISCSLSPKSLRFKVSGILLEEFGKFRQLYVG